MVSRSNPATLQATAHEGKWSGTRLAETVSNWTHKQWRRKIVEFRGAKARRRAVLPCFSPANVELSIATNSPDDSPLLSWVHSESLPSDSDKLSTSTLPSILHLFASSSLGVYGIVKQSVL